MTRRRSVLAMSALGLLPPALMLGGALNTRARSRTNFERQFRNLKDRAVTAEENFRISQGRIITLRTQLEKLLGMEEELKQVRNRCAKEQEALRDEIQNFKIKNEQQDTKVRDLQSKIPNEVKMGSIDTLEKKLGEYELLNAKLKTRNTKLEEASAKINNELEASKLDITRVKESLRKEGESLREEEEKNSNLIREVKRLQEIEKKFEESSSRNVEQLSKVRGRVAVANWKRLVTRNRLTKQIVELRNVIKQKNEEIGRHAGLVLLSQQLEEKIKSQGLLNKGEIEKLKQVIEEEKEKRYNLANAHAVRISEVKKDLEGVIEEKDKLKGKVEQRLAEEEAKVAQMVVTELSNKKELESARQKAMVHTQIVMDVFKDEETKQEIKLIANKKKIKDVGQLLQTLTKPGENESEKVQKAKQSVLNTVAKKANTNAVNIINKTYNTWSRMSPQARNILNIGLLTLAGWVSSGDSFGPPGVPGLNDDRSFGIDDPRYPAGHGIWS